MVQLMSESVQYTQRYAIVVPNVSRIAYLLLIYRSNQLNSHSPNLSTIATDWQNTMDAVLPTLNG